jgi:geranylgeranylglycerol-phosphate geranylgeranyltransferase
MSADILIAIVMLATAVATFMGAGNAINDIKDYATDCVNHPERVLPSERMSVTQAKRFVVFSIISSFTVILAYSIMFYSENTSLPWATVIIWICAGILTYTYEAGLSTKEQGFIGNLAISLMVGLVIIFGATASNNHLDPLVLCVALTAVLINLAREILKDCEDMSGDEGRDTLPMRIGLENARMVGYVIALAGMIIASVPYYLELGTLRIGLIIFQIPTLLNLITLNGVIHGGDDNRAQKRLRVAMATGLVGFVLSVAIA